MPATVAEIRKQAFSYLEQKERDILSGLMEFLRIPSISTLPEHRRDVEAAARFLARKLEELGFPLVEVITTAGHPLVYADSGPRSADGTAATAAPTVLIYGHYDVQPVDPLDRWDSPPFEPVIRDGKVFGRGASDDKGQVWMHLAALEALREAAGSWPLRVKFILEGEEETSSTHLHEFLRRPEAREMLAADVVVISDTPMYAPGFPSICTGLRGIAACQIDVYGPDHDLHSGVYGGAVANPATVLARLIASFHDEAGRIAIPGFYDAVEPLTPAEREAWASLPFDETSLCREIGVSALAGEEGYTPLERMWGRPTLEVNGIWGGFQGEGTKTIIPASAHAKITCRLVPHQDPGAVLDSIEAAVRQRLPAGVSYRFTRMEGGRAWVTSPGNPFLQAAAAAMAEEFAFGRRPVFVRMGGSIPVVPALAERLEAPVVLLGFALPGEKFHAPNEHFHLENLRAGMRTLVDYWLRLGAWPAPLAGG